jgi:AcrR family transcriptional regulator
MAQGLSTDQSVRYNRGMRRAIQETKKRLLEAATNEFAQRGIAGARVDRIAELAGCSKALIYDYFGNKDQLFDAVYDALVVAFVQEVPIDTSDLAGYAGRLFDQYQACPEILRLAIWDILERGGSGTQLEAIQAANQHKIAAIEQAQREGRVSDRWSPAELLALIVGMSTIWFFATPEVTKLNATEISAQRRTITEAVRRLVDDSNRMGRESGEPLS